jgi:hypothetical protein
VVVTVMVLVGISVSVLVGVAVGVFTSVFVGFGVSVIFCESGTFVEIGFIKVGVFTLVMTMSVGSPPKQPVSVNKKRIKKKMNNRFWRFLAVIAYSKIS